MQKPFLPRTGIEPARPFDLPRDFKALVSTYSTISALSFVEKNNLISVANTR